MTFGEKLQKLRAREGVSQEGLAELLDVSRQAVSKWERNETMPEAEKIIRISDYFHVTTDYLLKDGPEQFPTAAKRLPDLEGWYREKGYQLGWILVAYGLWWFIRVSPMLVFQDGLWKLAMLLLGSLYGGAMTAAVGALVVVLGRRCTGKLGWYHLGWLPVFWGALGIARILLVQILYLVPPENVYVSQGESFWEAYGTYLLLTLLAVAAGLTIFLLGRRAAAKKSNA